MDYKRLLGAAGYSGDGAEFVARKLKSRNIPADKLNQLGSYFPKVDNLAGFSLDELGAALYEVANTPEPMPKPAKPKKEMAADTAVNEVKDGNS